MIYIETHSLSPAINLAYEEYFLKQKDLGDDVFMLWRDLPAIVVGRFQNAFVEINPSFTREFGIQVIRRISGGGAVYHDLGNLCFSFIFYNTGPYNIDKPRLARPLLDVLIQLGIQVELTKRNDMVVDGKKFSGNALALTNNRVLYHGTLLFDADLDMLAGGLKKSSAEIESKGTPSVRSPVTNLKPYLPQIADIIQFKQAIRSLLMVTPSSRAYEPTPQDLIAIQDLATHKYQSWDWNFGSSPKASFKFLGQVAGRNLKIQLELEKGLVGSCQLSGEWPDSTTLRKIESGLSGIRYLESEIRAALLQLSDPCIPVEEFVRCLMGF